MGIASEEQLYLPVKRFLESLGYEVKGEVQDCDLVAVKTGQEEPVIVELKKSFNMTLLLQAVDRLRMSDSVYAAVEKTGKASRANHRKWNEFTRLCRMLGIGLMAVRFPSKRKPIVEVLCEPGPYAPRPSKKLTRGLLTEFRERSGDYNVGGTTRRKLVTAYREKALQIADCLHRDGPLSPRKLKELTGEEKTAGILRRNVYGWFHRVERGVYQLTEAGEQGLAAYRDVVESHQEKTKTSAAASIASG